MDEKIQSRINLQSAHLLLYSGQNLFSTLGREFQMLSFTPARNLRSYLLFLPLLTAMLTTHGRQKAGVACYSRIPLMQGNCQRERWRGWIDLNQLLLFHPISPAEIPWKQGKKIWQFLTPLIHCFWNISFCQTWLGQSLRLIKPVLWVILLHKDGIIPQPSPSQLSEVKCNLIL